MPLKYVENLVQERDGLATQVMALADLAGKEDRALSDSEKTSVQSMRDKITNLDNEIRSWNDTQSSFAKFQAISRQGAEKREAEKAENTAARTMGDLFVASNEWRSYPGHGTSPRFTFETRAPILTSAAPGSAFMTPDKSYSLPIPSVQTPLLDVIGSVAVSSNTIEYVSYPAAAPVAGEVAEGAAKPEAVLTATPVPQTLKTIAHWVQISRQAAEDSTELRSWIDGNLRRGVDDKLEALTAAAIAGATFPAETGADLLSAIRVGVGAVQDAGYQPNAVIMNPADYAEIDIQVMGLTNNGPNGVNTLWGLRVVPAGAVAAGTAYVGNWQDAAVLFYRNQTSIYVTDSHANTFIENVLTVLCERRAVPIVTRPEAACEVSSAGPLVADRSAGKK